MKRAVLIGAVLVSLDAPEATIRALLAVGAIFGFQRIGDAWYLFAALDPTAPAAHAPPRVGLRLV